MDEETNRSIGASLTFIACDYLTRFSMVFFSIPVCFVGQTQLGKIYDAGHFSFIVSYSVGL